MMIQLIIVSKDSVWLLLADMVCIIMMRLAGWPYIIYLSMSAVCDRLHAVITALGVNINNTQ
jgi:hypothetical protein